MLEIDLERCKELHEVEKMESEKEEIQLRQLRNKDLNVKKPGTYLE